MSRTADAERRTSVARGPRARGRAALGLAILLGAPSLLAAQGTAPAPPPAKRPVIGLVLGGGSARGMAHAGVLQWLEEHRIPIDRIAGNSSGALLGGAYATGMSALEIQALLRDADWDAVLRLDTPYALRSFRRKEDARDYAIKLEAGLRHGFRLQSGLNPGQGLSLLVSRVLFPASDAPTFDDLVIPFRCVATDLESGRTVIFDRGPLALSVRASMSLPGSYDPVRLNGRLYADGGILDNVPVDVARGMGADVVIAVRVGPKREEAPAETIGGIANRAITLMMQALETSRLEKADVVILPATFDLSAGDFRRSDDFAAMGYEAAEAQKAALLPYALGEADWTAYRAALAARRRGPAGVTKFIDVTGISGGGASQVAQQMRRNIGVVPDLPRLERDLTRVIGLGRYASATYGLRNDGTDEGLAIQVHEKSYGPPFMRFALDVNNENKDINLNLGSRVTLMDVTGLGSEWRIDGSLGSTLALATEFYQPVGGEGPARGSLFLAPHASYARTSENLYGGSELVAIYGRQRAEAGFDLGWNSGGSARLRGGYAIAYARNVTRVGDPLLPRSTGAEQALRARLDYDGQDAPYLPARGARFHARAQWFLEAPDAPRRFGSVDGALNVARSTANGRILSASAEGGFSFGDTPPTLYQFSLGGPFRVGALPPNALRGPRYALGSLGYRQPIGRLPKLLGGRLYASALVEAGSAFDDISAARVKSSLTLGFSADTLLGPVFAGGSVGQGGSTRVYFVVGRLVR